MGNRKLVVVSNRGPLRAERRGKKRVWVRSAGGLVTALDPVLRARGGVWISAEEAEDHVAYVEGAKLDYAAEPVKLKKDLQEGFYQGVSNAVLWPLLHSFPPTIRIGTAPWDTYVAANKAFAKAALKASRPKDLVWVHDYHLLLVPGMVREKRATARIGWFCHIPWPNPDLFGILPWRRQILEGLLGASVLGFHTDLYARNFLQCCEQFAGLTVDWDRRAIRVGDHWRHAVTAPIGTPVEHLEELSVDSEVQAQAAALQSSVGGRTIILGVDRLDYTKGIPERILAYEQFLKDAPAAVNNAVLVQVMVPSRTDVEAYAKLKAEVDRLVGSINGRYGKTGQVPIHYIYRNLDQRTLFAHYVAARVALVTPLRDGMNLVAHEYCLARGNDDGVLVLSEFAGAAESLTDAILVNPYDMRSTAEAIDYARRLELRTQRRRMRALRNAARKLDVHRWADSYLKLLESEH
ncbi:MAG: trehalose-6-phosphate synthase [Myxococcota bacterium]